MEWKVTFHNEEGEQTGHVIYSGIAAAVGCAERHSKKGSTECRIWADMGTGWRVVAVFVEGREVFS